jgi:hypothetical protein
MKPGAIAFLIISSIAVTVSAQVGPSVTFQVADHQYRIEAVAGALAEDLTVALDQLSPRALDEWVNISPDGGWLLFSSERFGCDGWACLALVAADFSAGEAISITGSGVVHTEGRSAVASGGNLVVFPSFGGPHAKDLYAISNDGSGWSAPLLLTGASPFDYHDCPALSDDGTRLVLDCGDVPGEMSLCEVGSDGNSFSTLLSPGDPQAPPGSEGFHHPDYAADGSYLVEIRINGNDTLWQLAGAGATPTPVAGLTNDNSPCGLADGRVASLWLERAGNTNGYHELKVMALDGSDLVMLQIDIDIFDTGLGCGGVSALIFADGFESGHPGAWSTVAP